MASTARTSRPAMKASLLKEMEVLLDEYLDWYDGTEDLKFREIEEEILQLRKKMGAKLAEVVVEREKSRRWRYALSRMRRGDAKQGGEAENTGEFSGRGEDESRALLLSTVPKWTFSPWTPKWRCRQNGVKASGSKKCG